MVAVSGILESSISEEISAVLAKQNAEEEFRIVRELLTKWFPEAVAFRPFLDGDPDERNRFKVVMRITLPHTLPIDVIGERSKGYHRDLTQLFPHPRARSCIRYMDFTDVPNALD